MVLVRLAHRVRAPDLRVTAVEQLRSDLNARDALLWNMTVIGEATSQLPESLRAFHTEVPWRQTTRMRNRIVHGYWGIDLEVVHTALRSTSTSLPAG